MDPPSLQFLFDEGVAVQPVGGVKRKETCHAHNDRAQNLIPDIEIVMRKAAALVRQDAVVGVFRRELRHADTKGPALFHAFEDEVQSIRILLLQTPRASHRMAFLSRSILKIPIQASLWNGKADIEMKAPPSSMQTRAPEES